MKWSAFKDWWINALLWQSQILMSSAVLKNVTGKSICKSEKWCLGISSLWEEHSPFFGCLLFSSVTQWCPTLCNPMDCSTPGLSVYHQLLEFTHTHAHLILCRPLLSPSVFPSIRVFSSESALRIRWSRYWSFSFNISPSNEHSELISFRMDWRIPWSFPNTGSYDARNASILFTFTFVTDFFGLDLTVACMKWLN